MVKKLVSAAAGIGLVLATVAPAFAAHTCSNKNTGQDSDNVCKRLVDKFQDLRVNNLGTVNHSVGIFSNSGNNTADNNTNVTGDSVDTDDADVTDSNSMVSLNAANATVEQDDSAVDEQGSNENTGQSSNNTVTFTTTKNVTVNVTNTGTVDHYVEVIANTGYNSASNNTNGGTVKTGKASIVVSIISVLNDLILSIKQ